MYYQLADQEAMSFELSFLIYSKSQYELSSEGTIIIC